MQYHLLTGYEVVSGSYFPQCARFLIDSGQRTMLLGMQALARRRMAEKAAQEASKSAGDAEEAVLKARKMALEGGVQAGKEAMEQVRTAVERGRRRVGGVFFGRVGRVQSQVCNLIYVPRGRQKCLMHSV